MVLLTSVSLAFTAIATSLSSESISSWLAEWRRLTSSIISLSSLSSAGVVRSLSKTTSLNSHRPSLSFWELISPPVLGSIPFSTSLVVGVALNSRTMLRKESWTAFADLDSCSFCSLCTIAWYFSSSLWCSFRALTTSSPRLGKIASGQFSKVRRRDAISIWLMHSSSTPKMSFASRDDRVFLEGLMVFKRSALVLFGMVAGLCSRGRSSDFEPIIRGLFD